MNWKTIRLELAGTQDFPKGSASRAYLLRLPVDEVGRIDERAIRANPRDATVRRFWPSEPDLIGHVVPTEDGFAFSYEPGEATQRTLYDVETNPLRLGAQVTVTEPDGRRLPFRIASLRQLN
jgi:hypothetical protein